ncbi:ABC transporter ATP-binding protein [Variovorax sp. H27-G14]|uniref:ATP-binding cassette domain-containing protein n=1 Tax=Variovorax sp. H27-G14 TaxID=3111914 RepID=UPI0038FC9806
MTWTTTGARFTLHFAAISIAFLLVAAISSCTPFLLRQAANEIANPQLSGFYAYALAYAACWTLANVLQNIKGIFSAGVLAKANAALNKLLLKNVIHSRYSSQRKIDAGVVAQDIVRATQSLSSITTSLFWTVLPIVFEFFISIGIIRSSIGNAFAILFALCILALSFVSYVIAAKSGDLHSSIYSSQNKLQGFMVERLGALLEVRLNNAAAREEVLADTHLAHTVQTIWRANLRMGLYLGAQALAIGVVLGVFTSYSVKLNSAANFTSGDFVMIAGYTGMLTMQLRFLSAALIELKRQQVALKFGSEYLQPASKTTAAMATGAAIDFSDDEHPLFRLENVLLAVEKKVLVFNLSHDFKTNRFTVISAPSGTGKSTLVQSMLGLLPVNAGTIKHCGRLVDQNSTDDILKNVAVASQFPCIFNASLRFNLNYGCNVPPPDAVLHEMLHALDYLTKKNGIEVSIDLDDQLGAGGRSLSGGEKQRISIARALLRNKNALVLDEPTAHLDQELARKLILYIASRTKTLIVITHDPEITKIAHDVLVLAPPAPPQAQTT